MQSLSPETINQYQKRLFQSELCLKYLEDRKVNLGAVIKYGIGYFDSTEYSMYYGRIMFPVRTQYGELVSYQGRALFDWKAEGKPKYYHGQYDKSKVIYGLHECMELAVKLNHVVIVEGPFDVVACYMAGIPAVAPLGTALSIQQAFILRRYVDKVYAWYDNDKAGSKAYQLSKTIAERADLGLTKVTLNGYTKDASEVWECGGLSEIRRVVYGR
jgi:DNA primase